MKSIKTRILLSSLLLCAAVAHAANVTIPDTEPLVRGNAPVATGPNTIKDSGKVYPNGAIVGTSDAQTLTGKTISGTANTLNGIPNSALQNSSVSIAGHPVSLGGNQALTCADVGGGTSCPENVGTTTGTVAAGDDSRITGAAQKANNGSDFPSPSTFRSNIGANDAGNLNAGTVAAARGGAGAVTGALKGNGSGVVSQAACADLSNGGTACPANTGTSGHVLPYLDGADTWAGVQTFTQAPVFTDPAGTRAALNLGTAATQNTGTSGATVPFVNGTNTWANPQTFTQAPVFTDQSGSRTALSLGTIYQYNLGNSVCNPGGGNTLETCEDFQSTAISGTTHTFLASECNKGWYITPTGAATDTLPDPTASPSCPWITLQNDRTSIYDVTLSVATGGCLINGSSTYVLRATRRARFTRIAGTCNYQSVASDNSEVKTTGSVTTGHMAVYCDTTGICVQDGGAPGAITQTQALSGGGTTAQASNATSYYPVQGMTANAALAETSANQLWPAAGTFGTLYCSVSVAPGSGNTDTCTLRIAGATPASGPTCTISNSATTCNDLTHTASITAGQMTDAQVVFSTSATSARANVGIVFSH